MAVNVRVHGSLTKLHSNAKVDFQLKRSFKKQLRTHGGVIIPVSKYLLAYEKPAASVVMKRKAIRDAEACKKHIWNLLSRWQVSSTMIEFVSREIAQTGVNMLANRIVREGDCDKAKKVREVDCDKAKNTYTGLDVMVELEVVRVDIVEKFTISFEVVHGMVVLTSRPSSWIPAGRGGGGVGSTMRRRSGRESVEFKVKGGVLEKCLLCREELSCGVELIHLPNCNHVFHKTCILQWFVHLNSCPCCFNLKDLTIKVRRRLRHSHVV